MLVQQVILAGIVSIGQVITQIQGETLQEKEEMTGDIEKKGMAQIEVPAWTEGEGQGLKEPTNMVTGRNTHEGIARRFQVWGVSVRRPPSHGAET